MAIAIIIIMVLIMAYFSGLEIAFISSNKLSIEIKKKQNNKKATIASHLLTKPNQFITVTLIGLNATYVIYGIYFENILERVSFLRSVDKLWLILIESSISTVLTLVLVDYIPKAIFKSNSERILLHTAHLSKILIQLCYPIIILLDFFSKIFLSKIFKQKIDKSLLPISMVDLEEFILKYNDENHDVSPKLTNQIFNSILELPTERIRNSIIPRNEIVALNIKDSLSNLDKLFISSKHGRIIIYNNDIDDVVGYCYHIDMLKKEGIKHISDLLRPLASVPESMPTNKVLEMMIKSNKNIALVVDEFGGTAGIVTLEDIVEEIFGEINDEYDDSNIQDIIVKSNNKEYIISGRVELDTLQQKYNLVFPDKEIQTLSGYIISEINRIPRRGDKIQIANYMFKILKVSEKKIERIKLIVLDKAGKST